MKESKLATMSYKRTTTMSRLENKRAFTAILCYAALVLQPCESFSSSVRAGHVRFTSSPATSLLESSSSSDGGSEGVSVETLERRRPRGWRVVGRFLGRGNRRRTSNSRALSEELYMVATPISLDRATTAPSIPDFIRENMERMSPDRVLPSRKTDALWNTGAELESVEDEKTEQASTVAPPVDSPARGRSSLASKKAGYGVVGRWTKSMLTGELTKRLTERWTVVPPEDALVDITPIGPNVGARMAKGQYLFDATMDYQGSIVFPCIQSSGGGVIRAENVCLNLGSFFSNSNESADDPPGRFTKPFELFFEDCVLTKKDWLESKCIRNGLARLLRRVVRRMSQEIIDPDDVKIQRLKIMPDGKLSCEGTITQGILAIPFGIRTWFDVQNRGHVLKLKGLEVSCPKLAPATASKTFGTVVVDLGHDAAFQHVTLDPDSQTLTFSGSVKVKPSAVPTLQQQQSRDSYYADCFVDIGSWFTKKVEELTLPQPPASPTATISKKKQQMKN